MAKSQKTGNGKGDRKWGRKKRKREAKLKPTSLFICNKITANTYFQLTNQKVSKKSN